MQKFKKQLGNFHTGSIIKSHIDKKKISKASLGRKIDRKNSTILHYQNSPSLQTGIVLELFHALKHNLFADLAAQLPTLIPPMLRPIPGKMNALPNWKKKELFVRILHLVIFSDSNK